jgi:hypothetical protein
LKDRNNFRVFENRVLREIFGPKPPVGQDIFIVEITLRYTKSV